VALDIGPSGTTLALPVEFQRGRQLGDFMANSRKARSVAQTDPFDALKPLSPEERAKVKVTREDVDRWIRSGAKAAATIPDSVLRGSIRRPDVRFT
jgi:hypothetical protein